MPYFLNFLYLLALLTAGPAFWIARVLRKKALAPLHERLYGFPRLDRERPVIWLHGVSVGEILAARTIVPLLASRLPGSRVVLSVTTRAGYDVARREYPDHVVFYAPLDLSWAVRRAVSRVRPSLLVLMELELWPNLLHELTLRDVPVVVANGKISERSSRGYRRILRLFPDFLRGVSLFCMQNRTYAERMCRLGADAALVQVMGNAKVDNLPAALEGEARASSRRRLGLGDELVWLAGSTHEGEETMLFDAFGTLRERFGDLRLVVAPRHVERVGGIENAARVRGLATRRSSQGGTGPFTEPVILVDTMGELAGLFAAADLVFLGGSLVPVGGHNVMEPAAHAKPVLFGPYVWTVQEHAEELLAVGAAREIRDENEFVPVVTSLLDHPEELEAAGRKARGIVDSHRGASARCVDAIVKLMRARRVGRLARC